MTKKNKTTVIILLLLCAVLIVAPVFALRGAEFGGSDGAGSEMVAEVTGTEYEPWFTPVFEQMFGAELPGELESLLFCVQTGIGVGVIAFLLGRFVERKKIENETAGTSKKVSHSHT
ncbi:energy-coupling factor ABC transporter substrate-binding protein [Butyricicoccus sp. Marseille-Q5471]|uniref:energy-coupling factor ABC transporter substrate-binding protein n=1 Tax=Butyricicoccus sp. Marseille-Q5471 TaxID=3039493 RepID=UPI0024BBF322|nr:cobalt transport protein CbiN [Butyricicoccus sp. Marseille-Q5471]